MVLSLPKTSTKEEEEFFFPASLLGDFSFFFFVIEKYWNLKGITEQNCFSIPTDVSLKFRGGF